MKKKSMFFLILLLSSNLSLFLVIPVAEGAGEDWLTGWDYRKSVQVVNATGAGEGYQVRVAVHGGTGVDSGNDVYLNEKGLMNFGDIRFTDDDGVTKLDHLLKEISVSAPFTVASDVGTKMGTNDPQSNRIARDSSGYIYVSFIDDDYYVYVAKSESPHNLGGTWTIQKLFGVGGLLGNLLVAKFGASIKIDLANDELSFVVCEKTNHYTIYTRCKLTDTGGITNVNNWYKEGERNPSTQGYQQIGSIGALATEQLSVVEHDGDGKAMVAFGNTTAGTYYVKYTRYTTSWQTPIIIASYAGFEWAPNLLWTADDRCHLTWESYETDTTKYKKCVGVANSMDPANWMKADEVTPGYDHALFHSTHAPRGYSMGSDSNNNVFFSGHATHGALNWLILYNVLNGTTKTFKYTAGDCGVLHDLGATSHYGYPQIGIKNDDTPVCVYVEELGRGGAYYRTYNGTNWSSEAEIRTGQTESATYAIIEQKQPADEISILVFWTKFVTQYDVVGVPLFGYEDTATFWVEVIDDLDFNCTIYLYYGNSTATTASNGENTFPWLFDDFDNYSINDPPNPIDWETFGVDPGDTIDVQVDPSNASRKCFRILESGDAVTTLLRALFKDNRVGLAINYRVRGNDDNSWYFHTWEGATPLVSISRMWDVDRWKWYDGGAYNEFTPQLASPINTWQTMEDRLDSLGPYMHRIMDGVDGTGGFRAVPVVGMNYTEFQIKNNAPRILYIGGVGQDERYIYVRKFVNPEPSLGAWGAQEEAPEGGGGNTAPTRGSYILDMFDAPDLLSDGERNTRFWFDAYDVDGYDTIDTLEFSIQVGSTWCNFSYDTNADGSGAWTKTTEQPYVELFCDGWGGSTDHYMMYAWIQVNPGTPDTYNVIVYQRITDTSSASSGWGQIYGTTFNIVESGDDSGTSGSSTPSDGVDDDGTSPDGPGDPDWWTDPDNLNDMSEDDLAVLADSLGIDVDDSDTKADIIADILALAEEEGFTPFDDCGLNDEEKLALLEYLLSLSVHELRLECQDLGISYKLWRDPEPYIILIFTVGYHCSPPDEFYEQGYFNPEDWDADGVSNWDDPDMFDENRIGLGARVEDIDISTSIPWIQQNGYLVIILALFLAFMYSQVKKADKPGSRGESLIRPPGKGYVPGERN